MMHSKSDNKEVAIDNNTDKINNNLFNPLLHRYQISLAESMKGGEFVFDHVDGLHYKYNKIALNRCRSCIDCPEWIKNKNAFKHFQ